MAYSRTKADIRTVSLPKTLAHQTIHLETTPHASEMAQPNIKREFAKVMLCTLPLIGLLIIASYLDSTDGWVVSFAQKVMNTGK